MAARYGRADLVAGNNVYAHVPDIRDFTAGLAALVKPTGLVTLEFPHLLRLIERNQYDTIYHEHYQYLSLLTASRALATAGLAVVDVDELSTHGGSLRVHARPGRRRRRAVARTSRPCSTPRRPPACTRWTVTPASPRRSSASSATWSSFLLAARAEGKTVVGYGAPGKGNTLLNHCGIRSDLMAYTVDRSPHKQGMFLPGTHIPIHHPGPDRGGPARLRARAAVEPAHRDQTEQLAYVARLGRPAGLPDPDARGGRVTRRSMSR